MENYKMEIFPVETVDGLEWDVVFPEVFGCGGAGKTKEEAIKDAEENLKVHIDFLISEGKEVPKHIDDYMDVSGKFIVRISKSLHKSLKECAKKENATLNSLVSEALANYIGFKSINPKKIKDKQSIKQSM